MRADVQKLKNCDFRCPGCPGNLFARNEVRSPKTVEKLRRVVPATLSHEMKADAQKLRKNAISDFQGVLATLSHEMKPNVQKLRENRDVSQISVDQN